MPTSFYSNTHTIVHDWIKLLNVSLAQLFVAQTVDDSHTIDLATIKYCNATPQTHSLKPKLKCLKTQRIHL